MSRKRYDWSNLSPDLLRSILEGLTTKDFHRARTICSNWYSVSTTCKRTLYPWRILLNNYSVLLYDPGEDKIHEIEHPGIDLSQSYVMASCSNWLLMVDSRLNFYLLNVFTRERIILPTMESLFIGQAIRKDEWEHFVERTNIISSQKSAVLWINERTGDYVVAWSYKQHYVFSYKKGDDSWLILEGTPCIHLACKDNKLYVYTSNHYIKIFDLSGDSPNEVVEGNPYHNHRFHFDMQPGEYIWKMRVAITKSGDVMILLSLKGLGDKRAFYIFKMNVETSNWERVDSLGGEMLIFGHGVSLRAPIKDIDGGEGIKSDSICFLDDDLWPDVNYFTPNRKTNCGVFDLKTSTITWPRPLALDDSFSKSFWFVPGDA